MTTTEIAGMTHDIRLATREEFHFGSCSCGWASAEDSSPAPVASAAVHHSINCGGRSSMAAPL